MESNHYLSVGTKLGGHYEIEKVLSEDDFEIIYLVQDLDLLGEYVVLKELFFKQYSQREGKEVKTLAKSRIVFEETKKEVKKEVEELLANHSNNEVKTFGSFEENNTIYTVMEFINNPHLDDYLKINKTEDKEEIVESTPKKVSVKKKEKPKSYIFVKILTTSLLICIALGYYAYNMLKEDKQKIKKQPSKTIVVKVKPKQQTKNNLPTTKEELLKDYVEGSNKIDDEDKGQDEEESTNENPEGKVFITDVEAYKKEQEAKRAKEEADAKALEDEEERLRVEEYKRMQEEAQNNEVNQNPKEFIPKNIREFMGEEETSNHPENDVAPLSEDAKEILPIGARQNSLSLGRKIQ